MHDGDHGLCPDLLSNFRFRRERDSCLQPLSMKKTIERYRYGIWIDHKKAIVFRTDGEGRLQHETLESELEGRLRFNGEETNKTGLFRHTLNRERSEQARYNLAYRKFLRSVIARLEHPAELLILGPGDARHTLEREISRRKSLAGLTLENRAADKMRIAELRDAVREYFSEK